MIRRRGEKESRDKEERRRAERVHLDVLSRQFSNNYVLSLCIMLIFRLLGVMPTFGFDI